MDAELYCRILDEYLVPFIQSRYPLSHRFMQDDDPKHVSASTSVINQLVAHTTRVARFESNREYVARVKGMCMCILCIRLCMHCVFFYNISAMFVNLPYIGIPET